MKTEKVSSSTLWHWETLIVFTVYCGFFAYLFVYVCVLFFPLQTLLFTKTMFHLCFSVCQSCSKLNMSINCNRHLVL